MLRAHRPPPLAEGVRGAGLPVAAVAPHVLAFAVGAGVGAPEAATRAAAVTGAGAAGATLRVGSLLKEKTEIYCTSKTRFYHSAELLHE